MNILHKKNLIFANKKTGEIVRLLHGGIAWNRVETSTGRDYIFIEKFEKNFTFIGEF